MQLNSRMIVGVALLLVACGGEEPDPGGASGETAPEETVASEEAVEPSAQGPLPRAAYGGTVLALGNHFVEVVVRSDGAVEVAARGDGFETPSQVHLTATITGTDGEPHSVVLTWDPARDRFRGLMRGVAPIPGAIEVKWVDGAQTHVGRSPTAVVSAPAPVSVTPVRRGGGRASASATASETESESESETETATETATETETESGTETGTETESGTESASTPARTSPVMPTLPGFEARRPDLVNRRGRTGGAVVPARTVGGGRATVRVRE